MGRDMMLREQWLCGGAPLSGLVHTQNTPYGKEGLGNTDAGDLVPRCLQTLPIGVDRIALHNISPCPPPAS
jgi:hypothetical protein